MAALVLLLACSYGVWRFPVFRADIVIPGVQASHGAFAPGWWKNAIEFNAARRLPVLEGDLLSVSFAPDGRHGWLLGAGNVLLETRDGGGTWLRVNLAPTFSTVTAQASAPPTTPANPGAGTGGGAVGAIDGITAAMQAEAATKQYPNAAPSAMNRATEQNALPNLPPPSNLKVDTSQLSNTGDTQRVTVPPISAQKLVAVPPRGAFVSLRPRAEELNQVHRLDRKTGYVLTAGGTLFTSRDNALTWGSIEGGSVGLPFLNLPETIPSITLEINAAGNFGTVGRGRTLFDGARAEQIRKLQLGAGARVALVDDLALFYALDKNLFSESGKTSRRLDLREAFDLACSTPDTVWVVGANGEARRSRDRGATWQNVDLKTDAALYAVQFADADHGWIAGAGGVLLRTTDGGNTWWHASVRQTPAASSGFLPYFCLPPVWWWLMAAASLGLVRVAWKPPAVVVKTTVEDILLTDRPLEPGERDLLGHTSRALGLSAFIRNTRTQPPLTLAITGEWGSGKSSLMNLLRGDLAHHGLRPVWFNAWHHQTEEHLLAALLANIRSQAVPPWWLPGGMAFRGRLLAKRVWREKVRWTLLAASVMFFAGLLQAHGPWNFEEILKQAAAFWKSFLPGESATTPGAAAPNLPEVGGFTGLMIAGVFGFLQLLRALRAFGVEPASLLATQSNNPRLQDLEKQTSFRYHFAREFAEVTSALGSRRMVVFIDDLDRCQPKQVYEMLESVNFLVSSGRCFIVLGLALERVERAVGLALKNIADAEMPGKTGEENPAETARRRAEYARHYLGKLINIEVRVPAATTKNYADLLKQRGQAAEPAPSRVSRSRAAFGVGLLLGALILAGVFDVGRRVGRAKASKPSASAANPAKPVAGPTAGETKNPADSRGNTIASFNAGAAPFNPWWIFVPSALALGALVLWRWRAAAPVEETDSEEFSSSLDHWLPVAAGVPGATPRSLKRFVNRVRYYAMLQKSLFSAEEKIPEGKLVSLAAYQERYPEEVEKSAVPLSGLIEEKDKEKSGPLLAEFSNPPWIIDDDVYRRFRSLSVGVNFRGDEPAPGSVAVDVPARAES